MYKFHSSFCLTMIVCSRLSSTVLLALPLVLFAGAAPTGATLGEPQVHAIQQGDTLQLVDSAVMVEEAVNNAELFKDQLKKITSMQQVHGPLAVAYEHWDDVNHSLEHVVNKIAARTPKSFYQIHAEHGHLPSNHDTHDPTISVDFALPLKFKNPLQRGTVLIKKDGY
ncbi:unnamed protein product [Rhizoctonia solani]|uniref:Uncharacterized protein n=1 Tax=Rhizoctonia solani TaxID=456999 RepID=A0A8H3HI80_9AGAM|nr:unnamed protein product [Rhizoctonia solani]